MTVENRELVLATLDGESHRYAEIVRRFDRRIRAIIAEKVRDPGVRDDLTQETFYRGFKNLHRLNQPDQLEAWLVAIARRCIADHYRNMDRRTGHEVRRGKQRLQEHGSVASPFEDGWVWDEVALLSAEMTQVLKLRYQLQMTYAEIAQKLNVPHSTIRGRIYQARKALMDRLEDKGLYP